MTIQIDKSKHLIMHALETAGTLAGMVADGVPEPEQVMYYALRNYEYEMMRMEPHEHCVSLHARELTVQRCERLGTEKQPMVTKEFVESMKAIAIKRPTMFDLWTAQQTTTDEDGLIL